LSRFRPSRAGQLLLPNSARNSEGLKDGPELMIAVVGRPKLSVTNSGEVLGDLDNDPRKSFRSYASPEGIHLTVWQGPPPMAIIAWITK
jgi:hypothetical protein